MGEGEGVRVEVVLPLEEVLGPRDDLIGVTEELPLVPLVELLGDVVLDMFLKANGTVDFLKYNIKTWKFIWFIKDVHTQMYN